jgi:hypothetical protein
VIELTKTKLTIPNIEEKISEYYNHFTSVNNNEFKWMVHLSPVSQQIWDELDINKGNIRKNLYISTKVHIYTAYESDVLYDMRVLMKHTSPIHQTEESQWVKASIHRYPYNEDFPTHYGIEVSGYRYNDGETVRLRREVPLNVIRDRLHFMETVHRICVELSRETMDVEGLLDTYHSTEIFRL